MGAKVKKAVPARLSKKVMEGRPVMCRNCYKPMGIQLAFDGGQDWLCPKCGLTWRIKDAPIGQVQGQVE